MKAKFNSLWWADEAQRAECMRVINVTIENIAQHSRWDASIAERVYNKAFDAQQTTTQSTPEPRETADAPIREGSTPRRECSVHMKLDL